MNELSRLQSRQNYTFILVCANFVMFVILFSGLGYVVWQSATLVNRLQGDVEKAEQTIVELRTQIQQIDTGVMVDRIVASATDHLKASISEAVQRSDFAAPIKHASEKIVATEELLKNTGMAIQGMHETIKGVNNEEIARLVSYQVLKGLGEGFQHAAESHRPDSIGGGQLQD